MNNCPLTGPNEVRTIQALMAVAQAKMDELEGLIAGDASGVDLARAAIDSAIDDWRALAHEAAAP